MLLFSIATDPTNDLPHCSQHSKIAGLEVRPMIRGVREFSGTRGMVGQFLHLAILRRAGNLEVCKGGSLLTPRRWIACFQYCARRSEDAGRVVIWDFFFAF